MHIQVFSDLHLECGNPLPPVAANYCIAAGDICAHWQLAATLGKLSKRYERVFYLPGNHEFYGATLSKVDQLLCEIELDLPNISYLRPGKIATLGYYKLIGCTLWYGGDPVNAEFIRRYMNDLHCILDISYEQCLALGRQHRDWLGANIDERTIVVTHHLPTTQSIAPQYQDSKLNGAFVNDCQDLILKAQPVAWIHGHTHTVFDYQIERTRILCNPQGYPNERTRFDDSCILSLGISV